MSRFRQTDVIVELIELCHDRMDEIRQQLSYYRASVYKDEAAGHIDGLIVQLRLIGGILNDDLLKEAFKDFDAVARRGIQNYIPGECSFSQRVTMLLAAMEEHLRRIHFVNFSNHGDKTYAQEFAKNLRKHREELLQICRQGTRHWAFFQSI
jgi:hypothetical protein